MLRGLPQHLNGLPSTLGNPRLHPLVRRTLDSGLSLFVVPSPDTARGPLLILLGWGSGALPSLSLAPGLPTHIPSSSRKSELPPLPPSYLGTPTSLHLFVPRSY